MTSTSIGGSSSYIDHGDGLRVRARTYPSRGTQADHDYVWDAGAGLPQILQDTNVQAGATTTFVYGLGLISTTDGSGNTSFDVPDGLGSTSQLTNSAGTITDRYAYDVFGAARSQSGTTANDFRFTGQQQDYNANRGLYDLRARFYDPALGRFLTRDPLPLVQEYAYVGNDPATVTDPTGLCGHSWNPMKYVDCPVKSLKAHPKVQRDIVLTADVVAIGFTGASAIVTDATTIAGCSIGPEGCAAGYALGWASTAQFRLVGNVASDVSTLAGCVQDKEGTPRFAKNCGFSVADSLVGSAVREPNFGTGVDVYQFCRDLGKCGP